MTREATLKHLKALTEACVQLSSALLAFEAVLVRENSAISRSDINELESITDEKIAFGEKVKSLVRRLSERMDEFVALVGGKRISDDEERQLSEFSKFVRGQIARESDAAIDQALDEFEKQVEEVKAVRQKVFPQIEVNAYLVKKLLQYHRETYAFWQAVAQEAEATYGQSGKTKSTTQRSILSVRT